MLGYVSNSECYAESVGVFIQIRVVFRTFLVYQVVRHIQSGWSNGVLLDYI